MNAIDEKLQWLRKHIKEQPKVTITYFKPDETKNGGAYVTVTGSVKKVDKGLSAFCRKYRFFVLIQYGTHFLGQSLVFPWPAPTSQIIIEPLPAYMEHSAIE